jgi:hypothetical protein
MLVSIDNKTHFLPLKMPDPPHVQKQHGAHLPWYGARHYRDGCLAHTEAKPPRALQYGGGGSCH